MIVDFAPLLALEILVCIVCGERSGDVVPRILNQVLPSLLCVDRSADRKVPAMGKGQILLYAALIPVSLLTTGVVAPPASAAGCKVEDDRAQTYSGLGYRTTAFGKKVTCDVGTTRRYAMIITCDPNNGANYTLHGKTVSAPEKSSVLCTDRGLFEFPDNVVDYYIRWS